MKTIVWLKKNEAFLNDCKQEIPSSRELQRMVMNVYKEALKTVSL